jgi:hypothetical protein
VNYRTSPVNDDKNVPEQTPMTVDNQGYEERFEDVNRGPSVKSAAEQFEMMKMKLADITHERERFYDEPGLIKGDRLQSDIIQY